MGLRSRSTRRIYELGRRIASGGMGEVYEGYAADLGRPVAVKRVLETMASEDDLGTLFLREVAVAATLEDPNVVEVLDAGGTDTDLFLIMELVDGPSLSEILGVLREHGQKLPVELTCGIVSHVARGLAHAHERALPDGTGLGIVHRDVAPENVLLTSHGLPKVVDFGLAKLSGYSLTNPGIIRGRPRNLSPEQARGDPVDARSDVFSLGAMLFEMVAGEPLYTGDGVAALLWRVAEGDYDAIAPRLAMVDADLITIIERAIAVRPEDRYRSAREVERSLDNFRAARGMRVDSHALASVVAHTWPRIEALRWERLEGTRGELEGARLVLEADRPAPTSPDLPRAGPPSKPDFPSAGPPSKPDFPSAGPPSRPDGGDRPPRASDPSASDPLEATLSPARPARPDSGRVANQPDGPPPQAPGRASSVTQQGSVATPPPHEPEAREASLDTKIPPKLRPRLSEPKPMGIGLWAAYCTIVVLTAVSTFTVVRWMAHRTPAERYAPSEHLTAEPVHGGASDAGVRAAGEVAAASKP